MNRSCIASKLERSGGSIEASGGSGGSGGSIEPSVSPAVKGASGSEGASMDSTAARVDASRKEVKLLCVDGAIDYATAGVSHVEFITRSVQPILYRIHAIQINLTTTMKKPTMIAWTTHPRRVKSQHLQKKEILTLLTVKGYHCPHFLLPKPKPTFTPLPTSARERHH